MVQRPQEWTWNSAFCRSVSLGDPQPLPGVVPSQGTLWAQFWFTERMFTPVCLSLIQELREIHNKQQLQKQKSLEAERLKQKEQERKTVELEKQKETQR